MGQRSISTNLAPEVVVEAVYGNFQMLGWQQNEVTAQYAGEENAKLEVEDDVIRLHAMGECLLRLPEGARVKVDSVHGNARMKSMVGALDVGRVLGSLVLRDVAETTLGSVYGELSAGKLGGSFSVNQVLGNATVRDVLGSCILDRIAGNLDLRNSTGDLSVSVGGNAHISLGPLTGTHYKVNAGGNVFFSVPEEAHVQVILSSGAKEIHVNLPAGKAIHRDSNHLFTMGNGGANIELSAGGRVSFNAMGTGQIIKDDESWVDVEGFFAGFSDGLTEQIESQVEAQMNILDEQMARLSLAVASSGLPPEQADRIIESARQSSEKASERAQEKMERVRIELERKLATAERKVEIKMKAAERRHDQLGRHNWAVEWVATPSARKEDQVAEEERLVILRMLEQKKISLAEAEKLLEALEGKS